ncbi:thiolase family protein [Pseudonocardia xishanensis]|uniref:Probable acetyl-CoA acetyltransferase n=1 Tax=Pseudonocardia xishanensis TaxID=630995 RepID=A0ABP8RZB6_9PSEU
MSERQIYLKSARRTAFGRFGGGFRDQPVTDLAVPVVKDVIARSGLAAEDVDHLVFGNVIATTSEAPWAARITALGAGIPDSVRTVNVNRACGTGVQAVITAAEQIGLGRSEVAVAAGAEAFSMAPSVLWTRWGNKRGVPKIEDMLEWAYTDPWGNVMGVTGENLAGLGGIGRDEQDEYALRSQTRAEAARAAGYLAEEIHEVGGVAVDEFPRPQVTLSDLQKLRPAFAEDGSVTAGNSSGVNDGAGAVMVISEEAVERHGVAPDGRIVDWAVVGVEAGLMGRGPVPATQAVLARTGLSVGDLDVCEVNEAFAVVVLYAMAQLKLDPELTNPNGGAISIGHPPGATGIRMIASALNQLARTGGRYGLVSLCLGGGMGLSMIVENLRNRS